MSERKEHKFTFRADEIAKAAKECANHHNSRVKFWTEEYNKAANILKETAKIEFRNYPVTGGERVDLAVNYGDTTAYSRMQEAWQKMSDHHKKAESYWMDANTYASQGNRDYELDAEDVLHYRLGGGQREE